MQSNDICAEGMCGRHGVNWIVCSNGLSFQYWGQTHNGSRWLVWITSGVMSWQSYSRVGASILFTYLEFLCHSAFFSSHNMEIVIYKGQSGVTPILAHVTEYSLAQRFRHCWIDETFREGGMAFRKALWLQDLVHHLRRCSQLWNLICVWFSIVIAFSGARKVVMQVSYWQTWCLILAVLLQFLEEKE
jgi:hypothetical protein